MDFPNLELTMTIVNRTLRAPDVVEFELGSNEQELPSWTPGSHVTLHTPIGRTREYSLLGSPSCSTWKIAVLRQADSRGGSISMHDDLKIGDQLQVSVPKNHFPFAATESCFFIAGGIGITALLPMIEVAQRDGLDWTLAYIGRTHESMPYADDLMAAYGNRVQCIPTQETGRPNLAALVASYSGAIYCCGPSPMLDDLTELAETREDLQVHSERFQPADVDSSQDAEFELILSRSDREVTVAAHESVLEAVSRVGVNVLSSCGEGTCGTCETVVLSGEIEHRDAILSEVERESGDIMMICVSRAAGSRLVLDL